MAEPRTYVVGLPVIITVHDDGRVTYDIYTAEAGTAVWDEYPSEHRDPVVAEETVDADVERIEQDHIRRTVSRAPFRQTGV